MNISNDDLKLFRGKRKNLELTKLAEEEKDFEYRRLFIEESKLDIQVAFSRNKFFGDMAIFVLFVHALSIFIDGPIFGVSLIITLLLWGISLFYKHQHRKFIERTKLTLQLVDGVIKKTYGISLPKYL